MFNEFNKLLLLLALLLVMHTSGNVAYSYEDLKRLGIPLDILHNGNAYVEFVEFISPISPSGEEDFDEETPLDELKDEPPPESNQEKKPEEEKPDIEELLLQAYFAYHKKDYEKSQDFLSQAEKIAPKNPKVNAMQGSLYYKLGFPNLAKNKWEKSLKANPDQRQVQYFLNKLEKEKRGASQ